VWREPGGQLPLPFALDDGALVIAFVFNAEGCCHLALKHGLPRHVIDLSAEFKCYTNGKGVPRKDHSLIGALSYFGLSTVGAKYKDNMRERILRGRPFSAAESTEILDYCWQDVAALRGLLLKLMPHLDLPIALHRGEAVASLALSQHHGVPIDMEVFAPLADQKSWRELRDSMVPLVDTAGIYVRDQGGEWHWNNLRFEEWVGSQNIQWPRSESGKLDLRRSTFDSMAKAYPQVEPLRQLRYIRSKLRTIKLSVGADGRNRTVLWAFSSKTSRTQPKAREWIFSPSVWLRHLIKPEPGKAIAYGDYSSMEFLAAAALSDGHTGPSNPMLDLYRSGDPYLLFGKRIGLIARDATRETPGVNVLRERLKVLCLGAQYGMQARTLATRLGVPEAEAHEMLLHHRGLLSQYWKWSDDWLAAALDRGVMRTRLGWQCVTGITELSERSIRNWPMQANSADAFRLSYIWGTRHGLTLVAPVHDAVLLESAEDRIEHDVALMRSIMARASRVVFGHEMRTDKKIIKHPNRYVDDRGVELWETVLRPLDERRRHRMLEEAAHERDGRAG
jgi:hypothetical protein